MDSPTYLLDVNILLALAEDHAVKHDKVLEWFSTPGLDFGVCAFSGAGFIRLVMNPKVVPEAWTAYEAIEFLEALAMHPGYHYWPMADNWRTLVVPFLANIQGHNQIPDAYLLGLALHNNGILATTDKKIGVIAGQKFRQTLFVVE